MIKYFLNILLLVVVIGSASFIVGMFWYIMCEVYEDFILDVEFVNELALHPEIHDNYFITYYDLTDHTPDYNAIFMTYWAFTTLSTVGFGDIHPISNEERVFCSFIFLFGVLIFSYIMNVFMEIVD